MREGWEYKKLGEIGNIVTGSTPSTKDESNYSPREYCFVKPSDLPSKGIANIKETEYYVSKKGLSRSRVLPSGTVLVSCIGSIGKIGILTKEACSNQQINAIIPNNGIDSKFKAYIICAYRFLLESIANAPVVPIINKTDFSKIAIPIPPKFTQLAIVSELDKINELIRLKKEQLKDLDKLAQNIFYEMFGDPVENEKGWTIQHLGDLCDKISNGYNAKLEEDTYKSEGIMYFRCQNVWRNHFDYSDLVYIDENTNQKMKSSSLKHNDFLITKIGRINTENSSLGRVSLYEGEDDKANLSGNLCFARLKQGAAVHKFILYILISNQFRNYIRRTTVGGIDKRALNVRQICSFPIISPPLPLQHLFAQRIEQIEHQKSEVQKAITDLETLLASRMQYWFE